MFQRYIDPDLAEILARIVFSLTAGFIVGLERKGKGKPAGIITNTMVCFGATMLSIYQQLISSGIQHYGFSLTAMGNEDSGSRIVAQIVSGIGFLGAGTIMRDENKISGITTAAILWFMACFGIVIGSGYWILSIAGLIVVILVLFVLKEVDRVMIDHSKTESILLICDDTVNIIHLFSEYDVKIRRYLVTKVQKNPNDHWVRDIVVKFYVPSYINTQKMLQEIAQKPGIIKCSLTKRKR
ncbi:MAG: MgtC/SapB family protein [Brevinema sp.]